MIASLLSMFGMDGAAFNPLGNYKTALYAIAIVEAWKAFGTTMIIYLAGLQTVDEVFWKQDVSMDVQNGSCSARLNCH